MLAIDLPDFDGRYGFECAHERDLLEEPMNDSSAFFVRLALAVRPCVFVQPRWNFRIADVTFAPECEATCTIVNAHAFRQIPGRVVAVSPLPKHLAPKPPDTWQLCHVRFGVPNIGKLVGILERRSDRTGSCRENRGETDAFREVASYGTLMYDGDSVFPTRVLFALAAGVRVVTEDASIRAIFGDALAGGPNAVAWAKMQTGSFEDVLKVCQPVHARRRSPRKTRHR